MSVTAYLHLEEAGENVYTRMSDKLGQSMYREGIIFWERRLTLERPHLLFERRPAWMATMMGEFGVGFLGKTTVRWAVAATLGKRSENMRELWPFSSTDHPRSTPQGETSGRASAARRKASHLLHEAQ